ncbi:RHS repeat-associated core domain-containing protein [Nocardia arthritidis]|uniref:Teneurin-like YD-shell domain-containing protein n=1 Tax=Nocardia arthritidis TaxID=228602 RepID=A0A6G9YPY9_9NOCA|nr:RHS repeat-associated core domain-containing protein [Nocardia arthritidis]QIS15365.1 hypothetical protein F5544_37695 [Nocardia arthritidis]
MGRRTTKQRLADDRSVLERVDYLWDGPQLVEQVADHVATGWVFELDSYAPIAQMAVQGAVDREFYAIISDLVGTPIEMVNPQTAETVATAAADLWGRTVWHGAAATLLRFPGQIYDTESGLHYNRHRHYDPATGRFLTSDPLGLAPAPNPNSYPHNPISWIDPLGLACRSIWTSTKNRSNVENAFQHWKKHGSEFPEITNSKQYVEKATSFLNNPGTDVLSKVRPNGDIVRFNPLTNEFGVVTRDGVPRTYYKPNPAQHEQPTNLDYFNAQ